MKTTVTTGIVKVKNQFAALLLLTGLISFIDMQGGGHPTTPTSTDSLNYYRANTFLNWDLIQNRVREDATTKTKYK